MYFKDRESDREVAEAYVKSHQAIAAERLEKNRKGRAEIRKENKKKSGKL